MAKVELKAPPGKFRLVIKDPIEDCVHLLSDEENPESILMFANDYNKDRLFHSDHIYLVYDENGKQLADEENLKR